jgi:hypothetical protein
MKMKIIPGNGPLNLSSFAFVHGSEDHAFFYGSFTTLLYLLVWTASLAAPFAVVMLAFAGRLRAAASLLAAIAACYLPWQPRAPWLRTWFGLGNVKYFQEASLLFEESVLTTSDAETRKLMCVHPHGIFCMGWGILFGRPELEGVNFCFSTALYRSPFFRFFTKLLGSPAPADKASFQRLMRRGEPMAVIPGGFEEATITHSGKHRVYIKKRRGFVKYALQFGYALVPCYCFGENETYWNAQGCWGLRFWLNAQGMVGILPFGRWWFPLLARNRRMHIVVGKALPLPVVPAPTKEQVAEHHARYVAALTELFERHKGSYGYAPDVQLEVW